MYKERNGAIQTYHKPVSGTPQKQPQVKRKPTIIKAYN